MLIGNLYISNMTICINPENQISVTLKFPEIRVPSRPPPFCVCVCVCACVCVCVCVCFGGMVRPESFIVCCSQSWSLKQTDKRSSPRANTGSQDRFHYANRQLGPVSVCLCVCVCVVELVHMCVVTVSMHVCMYV